MSDKSDLARLEFILKLIDDIEFSINRHGGVSSALDDREGYHAIMMCCMQIGENLNKIENKLWADKLPVSMAYGMRNVIAHDYIGISLARVAVTIEKSIFELKDIINALIKTEGPGS